MIHDTKTEKRKIISTFKISAKAGLEYWNVGIMEMIA
jgi:hypothetical protein